MYHQMYNMNVLVPLKDRDRELEELWAEFGDVPMDPESEKMEDDFLHFPHGTHGRKSGSGSMRGTARALPTCCITTAWIGRLSLLSSCT